MRKTEIDNVSTESLSVDKNAPSQPAENLSELYRQKEADDYRKLTSAYDAAHDLITGLVSGKENLRIKPVSTGFERLDYILQGGLRQGLYLIAGGTSVGKTALTMQIADNIASQTDYFITNQAMRPKRDILIFSLEMSKQELIARSISRLTFEDTIRNLGIDRKYSSLQQRSARQLAIEDGTIYDKLSDEMKLTIQSNGLLYAKSASNIYIIESIGMLTPADIETITNKHIEFAKMEYRRKIADLRQSGKTVYLVDNLTQPTDPESIDALREEHANFAPIIIVDYLQLMTSDKSKHRTDKETMDYCILKLKQFSRDYKTTIIGISSMSRSQYDKPASLESFKESGAIEYTADVAIGLQFSYASHEGFNAEQEKNMIPRELTLKVMKNRKGAIRNANLYFYPEFSYFRERTEAISDAKTFAITYTADADTKTVKRACIPVNADKKKKSK